MKKLLLLCMALLAGLVTCAQESETVFQKETVIIDFFLRNRMVPLPYVELLRGHLLAGFAERGRHLIVDAEARPEPAFALPGTGITGPESAAADLSAFLQLRAAQIPADARYLVSGAIADYKFEHIDLPSAGADKKKPRQGFRATFRVLISGCDLRQGQQIPVQEFILTASAPSAENADRAALANIRPQIEYFIDRNFKFESAILQLCPPDKKGRIRELYIHCGTQMGVKTGDLFLVYEQTTIGGENMRSKIGRLRVNDATNAAVAKCKITKGEDQITEAFQSGRHLICVSDGKAFGF